MYWNRYKPFFEKCQSLPKDAVVLIFGANNGVAADPIRYVWQECWQGFFVEPNPYVVDALHKNCSGKVIQCAVSDKDGEGILYSMDLEASEIYKSAPINIKEDVGSDGFCLTSFNRAHIESRLKKFDERLSKNYKDHIIPIRVEFLCVESLISRYRIPVPDIVQIDIEGMEFLVVPDVIKFKPKMVLWEHSHLMSNENKKLDSLAKEGGYEVVKLSTDTLIFLPNCLKEF